MAINYWLTTANGNYGTAANWSLGAAPVNTNEVVIPAGTPSITAGLDQTAVTLASFRVEKGYTGAIASAAGYLQIKTSIFEFESTGDAWIDLSSTAVSPQIFGTSVPQEGYHGLNLKGSNITTLNVVAGNVGVANALPGETATVTTARVVGSEASLTLSRGVSLTTLQVYAGECVQKCASTTTTVWGGTWQSREVGAITTLNAYGGQLAPESTGTITTLLVQGGDVDFTGSGAARTVTTAKHNSGTLTYDPAALTVTNRSAPDFPSKYTNLPA